MSPEGDALAAVWRYKKAALFIAAALAALVLLAVLWFWIPDESGWQNLLALIQGLVVIAAALWLTGTTLLFYRSAHAAEDARMRPAMRQALRRLPALAIWYGLLCAALWLISARVRWPGTWIVAPALLLPLAGSAAAEGFRGFFRRAWRWRYFPGAVVLLAAGAYLPWLLWSWHPALSGVALETASLAVRALAAYALAVTAWLSLASLVGRLQAR